MRVEKKEQKGSRKKKTEHHASLSSQWWGLIGILVGFNLLYSSVYLSPIMDSHMMRGEEGMMKKIGKAYNVEAVVVNLDEKADGTTAVMVRNMAESNVTLRLEIEIQNGVLWAQGEEQLLSQTWHDASQDLRSYVLIQKHVEPTTTEWPLTWIKPIQPSMPWSVHIEHEAYQIRGEMNAQRSKRHRPGQGGGGASRTPPPKIASRFWGGAVEGASNQSAVAHRHLRLGAEHHAASHGLFFDILAKDRPILVTGLRFSALASYQRHPHAPPAHISVYSSHTSLASLSSPSRYEEREWYLIGEALRAPAPAAPALLDLAIQPVYIAPKQGVSIALHSDFPFGISASVPSIEAVLRHDKDKLPGEQFLPSWLTLAMSQGPVGVKQNEFLKVVPGVGMARQPLKQAPSPGARGFMGLLQYRVIGMHEARDHGLSQLLRSQSSWYSHQHHRRKWRLYGEHVGGLQGGQDVAAEDEDESADSLGSCLA